MDVSEKYPLALPKGTVLAGQYVLDSVLGQGGFGITYKATDHKTGENVAVKEYFPDTLAYRDATEVISYPGERSENFDYGKEGFLQEAQTLAQFIGNENIARIHSYFEENGTAYFVMEYIEGISFDEYIKRKGGKITVDEAERVLIPIMDALDAVHAAGIVHRDVTPDNIYICQDGKIKLLDFGAARYSLGDKSRSLDVILKHGFAPKEQYTRRGRQGPYTDIYSIAATFYFAITGKRPPDSVDRLDEDDLIPPSSLGVDITDYQEKALFTALEVQPQNRFQSMAVFKKVLLNERIAAAAPVNTPPPVAQQPDNTQAIPHTVAASPHPSPVPQVAANGMPAAQAKKSGGKKIAIGAACVAIAAAIGAAVLIPGLSKSDDDDDDKDSSSKHSAVAVDNSTSDDDGGNGGKDEPAVTTAKKVDDDLLTGTTTTTTTTAKQQDPPSSGGGDASTDNCYPPNIAMGGIAWSDGTNHFYTGKNNDVYYNNDVLLTGRNDVTTNIIYSDGVLFYIYHNKIYFYNFDDKKEYLLSETQNYTSAESFYVTSDYYFVYQEKALYRINRDTGKLEESFDGYIGTSSCFCIVDDEVIFTCKGDDGKYGIYQMPADDFSDGGYGSYSDGIYPYCLCSDGEKVYLSIKHNDRNKICVFDADELDFTKCYVWDVTDYLYSDASHVAFINFSGANVFFTAYSNNADHKWALYHVTEYSSSSASDPQLITNFGLWPSIITLSGNATVIYYDNGNVKYNSFDSSGNAVTA